MEHAWVHGGNPASVAIELIVTLLYVSVIIGYTLLGLLSSQTYRPWPMYRYLCWYAGCTCSVVVIIGPFAAAAHSDFRIHMIGHLLLGMLGPLLMVLSAPMTLLLRSLPVSLARRLSVLLRNSYISFICHPVIAALLNTGGLWLLYTTPLYTWMHEYTVVNLLVHLHIALAGYVFTISLLYVDPIAHRYSYVYRAIVAVIAAALHGMLSKHLYIHPPAGVPVGQAEAGAQWMYYGGDLVQLIIIGLFCYEWYRTTRPRQLDVKTALDV
ncbi:cytochrome c oxidase assembly protein [Paenibacillus bovis]|uniref:Cytochrome c oxidase assembly protein n=1 Tax=Paenibacillus bovis TaxID=1616788 RepID=A0A172ZIS5_9BACL|nr:cytochrome c oxidase assembly protein [Paenibacillus bovis]ANF97443.1 hypothetical protein AR543_16465 [Paenibacillus bovis]